MCAVCGKLIECEEKKVEYPLSPQHNRVTEGLILRHWNTNTV